ncbi:MAG TPA: hypothetical protein VL197_07095 [Nitrospirota bacterium]|nr:hypothetical protein [Nitrospirota bacterium]
MDTCRPDRSLIARAILDHLSKNPDAQDTLEGIARGWMPELKGDQHRVLVKEVLSDLVTQGLIEKIQDDDRKTLYRVRAARKGIAGQRS